MAVAVIGTLSAKADTNLMARIDQINGRIQEIEANLIKLQGDRIRARHELEYGDASVAPRYQEAKKIEKELADLRKQVEVRLLATDPGLGDAEREVKALNSRIRENRMLAEAIRREQSTAEIQGADSNLVASLEAELVQSAADTRALEGQLQEALAALAVRKDAVIAADPETARLQEELAERQAAFESAFGDVRQMTDASEAVQAIDTRRQDLAAELQQLREERNRLQEAALPP